MPENTIQQSLRNAILSLGESMDTLIAESGGDSGHFNIHQQEKWDAIRRARSAAIDAWCVEDLVFGNGERLSDLISARH